MEEEEVVRPQDWCGKSLNPEWQLDGTNEHGCIRMEGHYGDHRCSCDREWENVPLGP